jgi:predicted nuclease of predicted toxin-antitoxin system
VKLLLDQNLSFRIAENLMALHPDSSHVRLVGLERVDDEAIWNFAQANGYVIVSKDSDFHQRSFLRGFPPKVVWIRCGNSSTGQSKRF